MIKVVIDQLNASQGTIAKAEKVEVSKGMERNEND